MQSLKRILCLCLMLVLVAGLVLPGHALSYALSGTVTSYGDANAVTSLWLTREGASSPHRELTLSGNQSGYTLENIQPGNYTLTVEKEGHVTRTYEVALEAEDMTLDMVICLLGDVSGDGRINVADVSITYAHCKESALLTDSYKLACADYSGNGKVNIADASNIYSIVKGTNKPAPKAVTLSVWAPGGDFEGEEGWLLRMEKEFQAAHPEYNITWNNSICHEGDAGHLVSENPEAAADVYMFANDQLGTLKDSNAILALGGQYLEQVMTDNSQAMINTVTYTDDLVYGFPMSNNTWFMYYNKDIFTEEDVKSLDTMLEKGTVAFPMDTAWYGGTFFLANGGTIYGDKGNDASAGIQFGQDNGGYEAALKMVQLAENPNFKNDESGLGAAGLIDGQIGAFFSGSWEAMYLREALGDKLGAAPLPTVEIGGEQKQMMAFAGSKAIGVNPHAANQQLALSFAAFLATPEAQKLRYEYSNVIPAAAALANDPVISQDPIAMAEISTATYASVVQPTIPEMSYYWSPVGSFGEMVASGEINLSNYRQKVDQMMEELNDYADSGEPGGSTEPTVPTEPADPELPEDPDELLPPIEGGTPITLKVWAPEEDQIYDMNWLVRMENQFRNAHPEYSITWINEVCHEGDVFSKMTHTSDPAADVYLFSNDQLGKLVGYGALAQVSQEYLSQITEDNSQTLINTVTHSDNGVYGFPISNNTWFMYYNKEIFTEEDVKSLDTMLTKGKVAFPLNNGWYAGSFFLANGGTIFGSKGNDASAGIQFGKNNGGYAAALKMVQLMANPNFLEDTNNLGWTGLMDGSIGALFSGSWEAPGLREALGDKLGAVQLPMVEIAGAQKQMMAFAGSKAVGVNPKGENTQVAMDFAAFLATPEAQKLRYDIRGVIPAAESLANDSDILLDEVAQAEIATMSNASVVQPTIPEMSEYWGTMGNFGSQIAAGTVNQNNYKEQVDQMMAAFGNEDPNASSFRLTGIEYKSPIPNSSITLRLHYYRPDGNYTDWNLWIWDAGVPEYSLLEPPYEFELLGNDMVCTVQLKSGTSKLGYIVRLGDWTDKDIHEDQFIDLTGILCGTVDMYVNSGVKGHDIVLGEDVWKYTAVETAGYDAAAGQLHVKMASALSGKITATLTDETGSNAVTNIRQVGNYIYFTFDQPLSSGSYSLRFNDYTIRFEL